MDLALANDDSPKEPAKKRIRSANYSAKKMFLIHLCGKYKHIIENKKTDAISWKQKDDAWGKIETEFNANSSAEINRDKDSLKKCYDNQKKSTRKTFALNRQETYKTGGGANQAPKLTPLDQAVNDIVTKPTMHGFSNDIDDDKLEEHIIIVEGIEDNAENNTQYKTETIVDWSSNNMTGSNLKKKPHEKLSNPTSGGKSNWTNIRRPTLAPTTNIAKKYEEVADIKKQVAEAFLKNLQLKEEREKEEHELKKELLLLEIKLKKKQLQE